MLGGSFHVTKKEIVKAISEEIGLTQIKTKEIVQKTFDAIVETLAEDGRIELRNFGVFEVKKRAARKARNPRTGEKVLVPEKLVVTFKPGKQMEERMGVIQENAKREAARRESEQTAGLVDPIQVDPVQVDPVPVDPGQSSHPQGKPIQGDHRQVDQNQGVHHQPHQGQADTEHANKDETVHERDGHSPNSRGRHADPEFTERPDPRMG